MDNTILKQLLRGALEWSPLPELSKEETEGYLGHLSTRGIKAKPTYWSRNGKSILSRIVVTRRGPEIDAEIEKILSF